MNHEEHEGHEGSHAIWRRLRLNSPLNAETEAAVSRTIGCAIEVHRRLGPGFLESVYKKAMCIELEEQRLSYVCERAIVIDYRGRRIDGQRVDLIVDERVVVELKAIARFDEIHRAQIISYLRTTGLRVGLLINFRVPVLVQGLRRIVL